MPNPAMIDDLESRWRPLVGQEVVNGQAFLGDAWALLRSRLSARGVDIEAAMLADASAAEQVVRVICAAVLRVLRNPDGKRQESIDDYSYTLDEATSSGTLHFTDDELDGVTPDSGHGGAFSVNLLAGWSPE